jgi:glyoxylase-like metal-dependent hydrolase (beta-lactamase superfamily II)
LYSGDLIYKGSLDAFYPTTDPKLFYQSIRRIRKYNIKKVLPGHHQLDIPVSLIADIEAGFAQLERAGKLKQGNGLFKFQDFQIHI